MKKRTKKYHPKKVRPNPVVQAALLGELSDEDIAFLKEIAVRAVDVLQMGAENPDALLTVFDVLRNLYVLSALYEEKTMFRILAFYAYGSLALINQHKLTEDVRMAAIEPIAAAVEAYYDMVREADRKELIASVRAVADSHTPLLGFSEKRFCVACPDDSDDAIDPALNVPGVCWLDGGLEIGKLEKKANRLVWTDPVRGSSRVLMKPAVILLTEDPKELINETQTV